MYNLRYHIASLVAVFLALSIGLLLGTVVADRGMITDQSSALIGDLQRRFDEINAANEELRLGVERDSAFAEDVVPLAVAGQLEDRDVVVLVGSGRVDGVDAATLAITQAGAAPVVVTLDEAVLGLDDTVPAGLASYFEFRGVVMEDPGEALVQQVADALVAEWQTGGPQPLIEVLTSAGLLSSDSLLETATVDAIVIMGPSGSGLDPFALACSEALAASGGIAVAAESSPSGGGVAQTAAAAGIPALDHVTTPQGRFTLVWLLAGHAVGYFGSGDGAERYYPELTAVEAQ